MARMTMDCRSLPNESNCSVVISGEEDEVLRLAAAHAVASHGHTDGPELRDELRRTFRAEQELHAEEGSFVQERIGTATTARWRLLTADRDRPDTYLELVGFPDHASAMRNSEHPVTADFAKKMQEATDGESGFRNLDVREVMRM